MKRLYGLNCMDIEELPISKGYKPRYINVHLLKYYYFITKIINKIARKCMLWITSSYFLNH